MKKIIFITIIQILTFQLTAQVKLKGNKVVILQEREIDYFDKIIVKNNLKVFLLNGDTPKVSVETDENLQEYIVTRTEDQTLEIYINQNITSSKTLNIYITIADKLLDLELRDKANVIAENVIECNELYISTSDKCKLKLECNASTININSKDSSEIDLILSNGNNTNIIASGSSNVKLNLKTNNFTAKLFNNSSLKPIGNSKKIEVITNGNGNFMGKDFLADDVLVSSFDSSNVSVNASKYIELTAENNSKVTIYNQPKVNLKKFTDKATLYKK